MVDPISEVWRRAEMLDVALKESKARGIAGAEAKKVYQIELAKKMVTLRESGYPAAMVPELARGDPEVAKLRFEKDCSEVVYESAKEAINVYKKQIDVLREQIDREWKNA